MKKSIKESLKDPFWAWKNSMYFLYPIKNVLSGVYFEKSPSRPKDGFYIWKFHFLIIQKKENINFNFGSRIISPTGKEFWENDEIINSFKDSFLDFKKEIIRENGLDYFVNQDTNISNLRQMETRIVAMLKLKHPCMNREYELLKHHVQNQVQAPKWVYNILTGLHELINLDSENLEVKFNEDRLFTLNALGIVNFLNS